jgi:hypothetical protein
MPPLKPGIASSPPRQDTYTTMHAGLTSGGNQDAAPHRDAAAGQTLQHARKALRPAESVPATAHEQQRQGQPHERLVAQLVLQEGGMHGLSRLTTRLDRHGEGLWG